MREKILEQETAEKMKLLEEINRGRKNKPVHMRLAQCEQFLAQFHDITKTCKEQRDAIQILLQLHSHEKSSQEMVNYLRDNMGKLNHAVKQQDQQMSELKKKIAMLEQAAIVITEVVRK
jgi:hypothetical protein